MALIARNLTVKGKMVVGVNPLSPPPSSNDVTPNAVNWTNVTGVYNGTSNTQTISGINTSITLRVEYDRNISQPGESSYVYINNVDYLMDDDLENNGFYTFTANNGDEIYFYFTTFVGMSVPATVTIKNSSDSNTILDTFTVQLDGDQGGGGG